MGPSSPRRRITTCLVVACALLAANAEAARAQDVDDLRRRAARLADEIERVGDDLNVLGEDYVVAIDEGRVLDEQIEASVAEVSRLGTELDGVRESLREFAVRTFAGGAQGGGLGGLLGGATELTDAVVKEQFAALALDAGQDTSDELESRLAQLRAAERRLEHQRSRKAELVSTIDEKRRAAEEKEQELLRLQQQTDADLAEALVEEQRRREAEATEQAKAEFERIKADAARVADAEARESVAADPAPKTMSKKSSGGRGRSTSGGRGGGGGSSGGGDSPGDDDPQGGDSRGGPAERPDDDDDESAGVGTDDAANEDPPPDGADASDDDANEGGSEGGSPGGGESSGGGGGNDVPPPSPGASGAIAAARSQVGVPYRFAAAEPGVAFDCSGLTKWAWGRAGVRLPHQSRAQYAGLPKVPIAQIATGDLIFYHSPIGHVGIYLGDGLIIHAVGPGTPVKISAVRWAKVVGVARPG